MSSDLYKQGYDEGLREGELLGMVKIILRLINLSESLEVEAKSNVESQRKLEELQEALKKYGDFYDEALVIRKKYPHYSRDHIAKKVIYENTALPYYIPRSSPDTADGE